MEVLIVGAHGQIGRLLARRLIRQGDGVRGVIRSPEQAAAIQEDGVQPVLIDLESSSVEDDLAHAMHGVDAVVFTAGPGPGSGAERKWTVDHDAAIRAATAAGRAVVDRFVLVSAMGTDEPPQDDSIFSTYLRAKAAADVHVRGSALRHTIVRPGRLTDGPATGRIKAARHVPRGDISRADVAAVLAAVVHDDTTAGRTFEVVEGPELIEFAIPALADHHDTED